MFEPNEVNVTKHNFILGFPHQQTVICRTMLLQQSLGTLLKLLWTDLFGTHPFWNNKGATCDLSESL